MSDADFASCFPACSRVAYRVAFRVVGSASEAEEIAQETLTRALVRWSRLANPHAWVARVALRLAIDSTRGQARHYGQLVEQPAAADDIERRLDLQRALKRLSRRQQEVLACRYLADLSDEETARALGISTGSVKQHAARALAALRGGPLPQAERATGA